MRGLAGKLNLNAPNAAIQWHLPPAQSFSDGVRFIRIFLHGRVDTIRGLSSRAPVSLAQLADAYERWGGTPSSFAARLCGDFILVVVNEASRETLFIRDALGLEPFYYSSTARTLAFATQLREIGARMPPGLSGLLNEGFAAEWLGGAIMTRAETLFSGIERLPPGSLLRASGGKISVERYWHPEHVPELQAGDPAELQQRFSALLEQAVARRIVEGGGAAAELSGGLDSSAVACLGKRLGGVTKAFSLVFNHELRWQRECDESEHALAVAKHAGLEWHAIEAGAVSLESLREFIRKHHALPLHPTSAVGIPMLEAISAAGCSVALSGQGGDDLLTGSTHYPADLLAGDRWIEFLRNARAGQGGAGVLGVRGVWRHFKQALRVILRERGWLHANSGAGLSNRLLDADFARRVNLKERQRLPKPFQSGTYSRRDLLNEISGGFLALSLEEQALVYTDAGLRGSHPFYDRDLYEFCLALPEHERQQRRVGKQILRRALRGIVPERILERTDKAEFSQVLENVLLQAERESLLELPEIRRRGWLNVREFSTLCAGFRHQIKRPDGRKSAIQNRLWAFLALELFLQELPYLCRLREDANHANPLGHANHAGMMREETVHASA